MKFNTSLRGGIPKITTTSDLVEAGAFQTKPNATYDVEVKACYQRPGANQAASYWKRALFRTNAAGVLTQVSTTQTVAADLEDAAGAQCLVDANGTQIRVRVAAEGDPTNWNVDMYVRSADILAQA